MPTQIRLSDGTYTMTQAGRADWSAPATVTGDVMQFDGAMYEWDDENNCYVRDPSPPDSSLYVYETGLWGEITDPAPPPPRAGRWSGPN